MAFPSKKSESSPEPPPLRAEERNWTCSDEELNGGENQCDALLKKRFVGIRTDAKDPKKFVPVCESCAGLVEVGPEKRSLVPLWIVVGALIVLLLQPGGWLWRWWER